MKVPTAVCDRPTTMLRRLSPSRVSYTSPNVYIILSRLSLVFRPPQINRNTQGCSIYVQDIRLQPLVVVITISKQLSATKMSFKIWSKYDAIQVDTDTKSLHNVFFIFGVWLAKNKKQKKVQCSHGKPHNQKSPGNVKWELPFSGVHLIPTVTPGPFDVSFSQKSVNTSPPSSVLHQLSGIHYPSL